MAFAIVKNEGRTVVNPNGGYNIGYLYEFVVESPADMAELPTDAVPGSRAYTADGTFEAMTDVNGKWVIRCAPEEPEVTEEVAEEPEEEPED